jgi:hypothetical protein
VSGLLILVVGGIWMLRDWIAAGNPLLPLNVQVFGTTVFAAPPDPQRYLASTLADYIGSPSVWTNYLFHQFRIGTALPLGVLAVGVVVSAVVLVRRRGRRTPSDRDGVAAGLVALTLVLAAVYALTPYSAPGPPGMPFAAVINVRYGVPAMIAAVGVLGWLASRCGLGWLIVVEVAALAGTLDALRVGTTTAPSTVWLAFALAAAGVAVGALASGRFGRLLRPSKRQVAIALAALALIVAAVGALLKPRYDDRRYRGADPSLDWVLNHTRSDAAVGLAGSWTVQGVAPIYPAFGGRLQNSVSFIGPVREGLLGRYVRAAPFRAALRRGGYQVLVLGRARHIGLPRGRVSLYAAKVPRPLAVPPEERWARAVGYCEVVRSPRFVVMAVPGFSAGRPAARGARCGQRS